MFWGEREEERVDHSYFERKNYDQCQVGFFPWYIWLQFAVSIESTAGAGRLVCALREKRGNAALALISQ